MLKVNIPDLPENWHTIYRKNRAIFVSRLKILTAKKDQFTNFLLSIYSNENLTIFKNSQIFQKF
jgi:hypothetical protein